MQATSLESLLKRDRIIVGLALAVLAALAWLYTLRLAATMVSVPSPSGMGMPGMPGITPGSAAAPTLQAWSADQLAFAFIMWTVMMIGMMIPSAAPMILLYARVGRQARAQEKPFASTFWFAGGYLLAWTGFSLIATIAQAALTSALLLTPLMALSTGRLAGLVLIGVGIYQFTPLKDACLSNCQMPMAFLMRHGGFKSDPMGSLGLGLRHGLYCVGCCWALMLSLFALGVMNVLWIALLSILILLEKTVPGGNFPTRAAGLVLLALGAIFLYRTGM